MNKNITKIFLILAAVSLYSCKSDQSEILISQNFEPEEIETEIDIDKNTKAFTAIKNPFEKALFLSKDGEIIEIKTIDPSRNFAEIQGEQDGKYLSYKIIDDEWEPRFFYNIENQTEIHNITLKSDYGFSSDGKYFYQCSPTAVGSGEMKAYQVLEDDFKRIRDFHKENPENIIAYCGKYQADENYFVFELGKYNSDQTTSYSYYFDTDTLKEN